MSVYDNYRRLYNNKDDFDPNNITVIKKKDDTKHDLDVDDLFFLSKKALQKIEFMSNPAYNLNLQEIYDVIDENNIYDKVFERKGESQEKYIGPRNLERKNFIGSIDYLKISMLMILPFIERDYANNFFLDKRNEVDEHEKYFQSIINAMKIFLKNKGDGGLSKCFNFDFASIKRIQDGERTLDTTSSEFFALLISYMMLTDFNNFTNFKTLNGLRVTSNFNKILKTSISAYKIYHQLGLFHEIQEDIPKNSFFNRPDELHFFCYTIYLQTTNFTKFYTEADKGKVNYILSLESDLHINDISNYKPSEKQNAIDTLNPDASKPADNVYFIILFLLNRWLFATPNSSGLTLYDFMLLIFGKHEMGSDDEKTDLSKRDFSFFYMNCIIIMKKMSLPIREKDKLIYCCIYHLFPQYDMPRFLGDFYQKNQFNSKNATVKQGLNLNEYSKTFLEFIKSISEKKDYDTPFFIFVLERLLVHKRTNSTKYYFEIGSQMNKLYDGYIQYLLSTNSIDESVKTRVDLELTERRIINEIDIKPIFINSIEGQRDNLEKIVFSEKFKGIISTILSKKDVKISHEDEEPQQNNSTQNPGSNTSVDSDDFGSVTDVGTPEKTPLVETSKSVAEIIPNQSGSMISAQPGQEELIENAFIYNTLISKNLFGEFVGLYYYDFKNFHRPENFDEGQVKLKINDVDILGSYLQNIPKKSAIINMYINSIINAYENVLKGGPAKTTNEQVNTFLIEKYSPMRKPIDKPTPNNKEKRKETDDQLKSSEEESRKRPNTGDSESSSQITNKSGGKSAAPTNNKGTSVSNANTKNNPKTSSKTSSKPSSSSSSSSSDNGSGSSNINQMNSFLVSQTSKTPNNSDNQSANSSLSEEDKKIEYILKNYKSNKKLLENSEYKKLYKKMKENGNLYKTKEIYSSMSARDRISFENALDDY